MKSIIITLILFTSIATATYAGNFGMVLEDEMNANDIPFDTEWIALTKGNIPAFELEEEAYIDDIPFNTENIMRKAMFQKMEQEYTSEASVEDIPFNTREVVTDHLVDLMYASYSEEEEVDDMPFPAEYIAYASLLESELVAYYQNEGGVDDIPFHAECIASEYLLQRAVEEYRQEESKPDYPFKTREIYCQKYVCPKDTEKLIDKELSNLKFPRFIELESEGYDITRYLDKMMETIEDMHISSGNDYEKKVFYLNNSFDAL